MNYGHFDDERREYVITNPRTPVKWINYIGTLDFGGFVDQTGGSLICKGDPALNRITKYLTQTPASDVKGETLYVRVGPAGARRVFSPYFTPTLDRYDSYECRVGLGYTTITSEFHGIRTSVRIFVPRDASVVLREITVTNTTREPLALDVIPVVEYTHPDALKQLTNADWVPQTMQSAAISDSGGPVILTQFPFMFRDTRVNYFTSSVAASSFETDRRRFLGDNEYGTWAHPLALDNEELSNHEARRGDNIAALMIRLGTVEPGGSRRLVTMLGQAPTIDAALPAIRAYRQQAAVAEAFDDLRRFWDDCLACLSVATPDPAMDGMVNVHNPRQCYITKNWSRYLSLYQLGFGSRGIGFRDSSQDVLGVLDRVPKEARELITKLLTVQKRDGSAMHQFNPLTMMASEGDSLEREDRPSYYSDDHLWIVLAVCWYLKETGEISLLDHMLPYYEKDRSERALEQGSVLDHLRRAIEFTSRDIGAHGLPLLGFADWNDTVNLGKGAESPFTACLYGAALREMQELARHIGDASLGDRCRQLHESMRARFEEHAWDGAWYVRYFDVDGTPLGSHGNDHGRIYVNSQSWAVISGFASEDRARRALDSVHRHLNTSRGIKLSAPGFDGFDPARGGITTYPPGAKENGGIFLHTNPWVMIAECMLGNGDRAFEYYRQINPAAKNDVIDEFECEPYVYPQNILGDEHPQFGLARNSWLSGTAAWAYTAATKYILGLLPAFDGLRIAPCIPRNWDGFRAVRTFRNAVYRIHVANPRHVNKGVAAMTVDGTAVGGSVVPIFGDGREHVVDAVMGHEPPARRGSPGEERNGGSLLTT